MTPALFFYGEDVVIQRNSVSSQELDPEKIPFSLQLAWIKQLQRDYRSSNWLYLNECMKMPIINLNTSTSALGRWDPELRTISISIRHILEHPWDSVRNTLRHEMAHQYLNEHLHIYDETPHGPSFEKACRLLRCDPASVSTQHQLGTLSGSRAERDSILTRIKELLAMGNSPNQHEAETAMRLANRELLKYKLKFQDLEERPDYGVRYLRNKYARIQEYQSRISYILQDHFYVEIIQITTYNQFKNRSESLIEISGRPEDLDIAEYVYYHLMHVCDQLWEEHKAAFPGQGGTKFQYLAGLMAGFEEKLDRQKSTLKEEKGLVWLGDKQLKDFYHHRHPRICTIHGTGVSRNHRFSAGRQDGKNIVLRKPIKEGKERGRLLNGPQ